MSIPKTIYQTFKTSHLPLLTRWHIHRMKKRNPEYDYQFYDDERIDKFIHEEFDRETYTTYKRIKIGAAKADFFRYAVLYKRGGIYLDIDSLILCKLDHFIDPGDSAIISLEGNLKFYIQYALFFEAGHPFLEKTLAYIFENIRKNKYPKDIHKMTGPSVYSRAISDCLKESKNISYRQISKDYEDKVKFSYRLSKFFLYGISRKNHWKTLSKNTTILEEDKNSIN